MSIIEPLLLSIIAICASIAVFASFMELREYYYYDRYNIDQLTIHKTTFIELVLNWCSEHQNPHQYRMPRYTLKYKVSKRLNGFYRSANEEIGIYVNNNDHASLINLVNTVIHEYTHYLQSQALKHKSKNHFIKLYKRYNSQIGYKLNPFELEAWAAAKYFERQCLKDVLKLNPEIISDSNFFNKLLR
jgi:hypothetical protein